MKNFIELRHWDSLPIERAERLTEIIASLFYVPENRERLESYFEDIREEDVFEAKANLQARGAQSAPYGQPLEFWKEFLGLEVCWPTSPAIRSIRTYSRNNRNQGDDRRT